MKAFEVRLNGSKIALAGIGSDGVLTTIVDYVGGQGKDEIALSVGGLISPQDRHVRWVMRRKLKVGDEIKVSVVDAKIVDRPKSYKRVNRKQQLRDVKRYVREQAKLLGWTVTENKRR